MDYLISSQFERICRTCMATATEGGDQENLAGSSFQLQSIFDSVDDCQNKVLNIFELLNITVYQLPAIQEMDTLPKLICTHCLEKLRGFYEFQQTCLSSDSHFRKLLTPFDTQDLVSDPLDNKSNINAEEIEHYIHQELVEQEDCTGRETTEPGNDGIIKGVDVGANSDLDENNEYLDCNQVSEIDNDISSRKKFICNKCDKTYANAKSLKRHMIRLHIEANTCLKSADLNDDNCPNEISNIFECNECDATFKKPSYLRKHRNRHKRPGGLKKDNKCDICGEACKTIHMLRNHKRIVHQEHKSGPLESQAADPLKPYVCEYCNKGFQQSCTLKDHVRIHTKEQPFLCSECGKAFNSNSNLQQHLLRHTGERRYECPDCPKKFPCLSDLASHKQVHKKLRPHICDICSAAFGKPYQLKKHKMYHNGEKPYQCEYCEMRFVCGDHQRRHMRTHTGEKPYKCEYCSRTFTQSNDMIKHLRSHLGQNVYRCELCPLAFRLAAELREHFAMHKNDDKETRERNKRALLEAQEKLRIKLELDRAISVKEKCT